MMSNEDVEIYITRTIPEWDPADRDPNTQDLPKKANFMRIVILCDRFTGYFGNPILALRLDKFTLFKLTAVNLEENQIIAREVAANAEKTLRKHMQEGDGTLFSSLFCYCCLIAPDSRRIQGVCELDHHSSQLSAGHHNGTLRYYSQFVQNGLYFLIYCIIFTSCSLWRQRSGRGTQKFPFPCQSKPSPRLAVQFLWHLQLPWPSLLRKAQRYSSCWALCPKQVQGFRGSRSPTCSPSGVGRISGRTGCQTSGAISPGGIEGFLLRGSLYDCEDSQPISCDLYPPSSKWKLRLRWALEFWRIRRRLGHN